MNSKLYSPFLEEKIVPLMSENKYIYQQDNAPYHTSSLMLKFFAERKIEVMYWPPYSPDLNPIENIWNVVKTQTRKKIIKQNKIRRKSIDIIEILTNMPISFINNIIFASQTMDNRIEALYNNNFSTIDY